MKENRHGFLSRSIPRPQASACAQAAPKKQDGKDPCADQTPLKNREKAAIVDVLKNKHPLPKLFQALHDAHSNYYYPQKAEKQCNKYATQKEQIRRIFEANRPCYGYRRIYLSLRRIGVRLSENVIRRLMKQERLQPKASKKTSI